MLASVLSHYFHEKFCSRLVVWLLSSTEVIIFISANRDSQFRGNIFDLLLPAKPYKVIPMTSLSFDQGAGWLAYSRGSLQIGSLFDSGCTGTVRAVWLFGALFPKRHFRVTNEMDRRREQVYNSGLYST